MKKLMIGGVLSLFMGGIAFAGTSVVSMNSSANQSTLDQTTFPEVPQIIGFGNDEGGFYYILSDSKECWKYYPKVPNSDIKGIVD